MKSFWIFGKNNSKSFPAPHWSKENSMLSTEGYQLLLTGPEQMQSSWKGFQKMCW